MNRVRALVPQQTSPTTKLIRTGEGILVFLFNLAMLIVPIVSNALTPLEAVKWAGILNAVAFVSRSGLKGIALITAKTGLAPTQVLPGQTPQDIAALTKAVIAQLPEDLKTKASPGTIVDQVAEDEPLVEQVVKDAEEFSAAPGEELDPPQPKTFRNDPHTTADAPAPIQPPEVQS